MSERFVCDVMTQYTYTVMCDPHTVTRECFISQLSGTEIPACMYVTKAAGISRI